MTGASRKIGIVIYPHPSDARESQKDTPFLFFLFRRQRVSKGVLILLFSAAPVALPVLPARRDSRRALPQQASHC